MSEHSEHTVRERVEAAIRAGSVKMKPRWHFVLFSAFAFTGIALVFAGLLYITSLAVFFLRQSGAWFQPAFGSRGWLALLHSLPWLLILLVFVFIVLLEILARRYAFVYRRSLVTSLLALAVLAAAGGFFIAKTPFHREMYRHARQGDAPAPLGALYRVFHPAHPDLYRGTILRFIPGGFIIVDQEDGTSTIRVSPRTRLPYGADFSEGDFVVILGDRVATDTVQAFGVRMLEDEMRMK